MVVAETRAQALDAAEAVEVEYEELPFVIDIRGRAASPARRRCGTKCPTTCSSTPCSAIASATDRAFAQAAHVVKMDFHIGRVTGVPMEPRAALGALRRGDAAATRSMPAAAARCGRSASSPPCSALRPTSCACCPTTSAAISARATASIVEFGLVLWAARQARPAGQIHRHALGGLPHRLPGPRSRHQGRARAAQGRPFPRHARRQHQQRRRALRLAVAARQGLGPDHRLLRHSGRDAARARGVHQHHADQRLSQLRPAGGDVRDRAADRHGGRTSSASTASSCAARISCGRRRCRTRNAVGMTLRQRHLRGQHGPRACEIADWEGFEQRKREAKKRGKLLGLGLAQLRRVLDRLAEGAHRDHGEARTAASTW